MAKSKFLQLLNSAVNTNPEELEKWIEEQINTKDENQRTFLHKASKAGNLPTVKYLIQIGAQIDAKDANEYTPLLAAVNGNNLEVVKYLIDNGALIDAGDVDGDTPLHIATYGSISKNVTVSLELVKLLIEKGAPIDAKNQNEDTPLHSAVHHYYPEIAQCLIDNGAQIDARSKHGDTLLHIIVCDYGTIDVEVILKLVKFFIEKGAQINAKNRDGNTPLHLAVHFGYRDEIATSPIILEMVQCLIDNGAQIDAKNKNRETPLHLAVDERWVTPEVSLKIVKLLIERGAQIDAKDQDGNTPLHIAANRDVRTHRESMDHDIFFGKNQLKKSYRNSMDLVKILIEKGAQIDAKNNNNETPFYLANRQNRKEIAKYILEKKREIENQNAPENFSTKDPCIICMEPRNGIFVLFPCGHISLCELCSYNLTQETHPKCPTCRKPVREYTKGFIQAPDLPVRNG